MCQEPCIATRKPAVYESAGFMLEQVRELLHRENRPADWERVIADVRDAHRRKTRLTAVLDALEARPVIPARRRRKKRSR